MSKIFTVDARFQFEVMADCQKSAEAMAGTIVSETMDKLPKIGTGIDITVSDKGEGAGAAKLGGMSDTEIRLRCVEASSVVHTGINMNNPLRLAGEFHTFVTSNTRPKSEWIKGGNSGPSV